MKKLVSTLNLPHEEWLMYRKQGIGGSDAGAVCGLNPYSSPIKVYYDKTKDVTARSEDIDNESMRQGRDLEEYVAKRFTETTGLKVRRANAIFYDEKRPYMIGDVDRLIVGRKAGLECKTVSPYSENKWEDGNIPLHYQIQCYHYMSIFDVQEWYIAALIFGRDFIVRKLTWDEDVIESIRKIEGEFWNNNVLMRAVPKPDGSEISDRLIADTFSKAKEGQKILLTGFSEKLTRRAELAAKIEEMSTEKSQIEQELKLYLKDSEMAEGDGFQVF